MPTASQSRSRRHGGSALPSPEFGSNRTRYARTWPKARQGGCLWRRSPRQQTRACKRLEKFTTERAIGPEAPQPGSAAPAQGSGLDRVFKRAALGAGAAVFAFEPIVPLGLGVGVID